ncbi:uncharacterized protein B0I36DRAFT_349719 [Microdochium trichocladiopsis]|uniref:Uncharacterized protein n=1 Tax=Microdochium trichocladiopsis TaxID=1682393 RepID=A0A9P8YAB7_9PEZI|nr:uncharacterized protein B0I36DRAFT_349719 [Microdochium trichocladiopsis]KAH7031679.1 hypothetical protein B0I36DRAFT_349719 [Microdochium trichocladiopsis]
MPSSPQRPFFLSSFFAAFRQQPPSASALAASSQASKHGHPHGTQQSSSNPAAPRSITTGSHSHSQQSTVNQVSLHSPRGHGAGPMPIVSSTRRRGSDSSSEGFRDVLGADKWYIGGRTAAGEEKFFKLGVVKRQRSQDRLSLDRLSL